MEFKETEMFLEEVKSIYKIIPKREKTFMEIEGYPHYENVSSNILAFYLNPNEEHKLKDLVVSSLLKVTKQKDEKIYNDIDLSYFNVYREYVTLNVNRIDIVLQNNDVAIGIENKLDANVYNDLNDYEKTINKLNKNAIKILLSLHDESTATQQNGFINITYNEFFHQLKKDLENVDDKENKWYIYLIDFINNLLGFEVEKKMEKEINNWINTKKEEIKEFKKLLNIAQDNINKKVDDYVRVFKESYPHYNIKYYYGEEEVATTAYIVFDCGCNLDVKLSTEGWMVGIFAWKRKCQPRVKELLNLNGINYIEEENHYWLPKLNYETDIKEIINLAKKLLELIKQC